VLHHTPNTQRAVTEILRVLKPGGRAIVMFYAESSLQYWRNLVWYYGLRSGDLASRSMSDIMSRTVERTGNEARPLVKVYTKRRLRALFKNFAGIQILQQNQAPDLTRARTSPPPAAAAPGGAAGGLEPDYQGSQASPHVMLKRMSRLLARVRGAQAHPVPPKAPPVKWRDDLADAGLTADAWIAERLMAGRLFVGLPEAGVERLRAREPELVQSTIKAADRVLRHEFDLLGSGPYTPVDPDRAADPAGYQPIDWYLDPVSGLRFPRGIPHTEWHLDSMRPDSQTSSFPGNWGAVSTGLTGEAYRLTGDDSYAID
jgi:SAM-dependent methyltransferase